MKTETPKRITRWLRFRLTLSYALFFTLLLSSVGVIFHTFLKNNLDSNIRDILDQDWAALRGYLRIEKGTPKWFFDPDDSDENYIVSRLKRVYLITDARGTVLEGSSADFAKLIAGETDKWGKVMKSAGLKPV